MKIDAKALDIAHNVFSASERAPYGEEEVHEALRKTITAYLTVIEEAGFVVVPSRPTESMIKAFNGVAVDIYAHRNLSVKFTRDAYRAMLAARDAT